MRFNATTQPMSRPTQEKLNVISLSSVKMCFWFVVVLACLPQLATSTHQRVQYDNAAIAYTGRGCTEDWCNETWRAGRILYYNLTVETKLVLVNKTEIRTINNCEGAQTSVDCEEIHSEREEFQEKDRIDTVLRVSDEPDLEVHDNDELKHSYLLSDNMVLNNDNGLPQAVSDFYPANLTKIWQLRIPKGCKMDVLFSHFSIEESENCEHDYFSVQTSRNPDDVLVFCNTLERISIKSRRRVQFTLHSDYANNMGKVAAHICLSLKDTDSGVCDCPEGIARRRRLASTTSLDEDDTLERLPNDSQQLLSKQRLAALQRLRNRRQSESSS